MALPDPEFEIVDTQAPVRQGDILLFPRVDDTLPWDQMAIVLTADCDLAWGASRGLVTVVPIVSVETYIKHVWAEKKLRNLRAKSLSTCRSMLAKRREGDEEELEISELAVARWIETTSASAICDERRVTDERERESFAVQSQTYLKCNQELGVPPRECLSILLDVRCMASKASQEIETSKAVKQAGSELQEIPQDTFYVSSLPGVEGTGFYALLRDLGHFPVARITSSLAEAKEMEGRAFRAARLKPVFKYSLVQQFALLFLRIGLPQAYQDAYRATVAALELPATKGPL